MVVYYYSEYPAFHVFHWSYTEPMDGFADQLCLHVVTVFCHQGQCRVLLAFVVVFLLLLLKDCTQAHLCRLHIPFVGAA